MNIKPRGQRAIIKPIIEENRSKGGLIVKEVFGKGEIIEVSDTSGTSLKKGDIVFYEPNTMFPISVDDKFLIHESNIVAIINE